MPVSSVDFKNQCQAFGPQPATIKVRTKDVLGRGQSAHYVHTPCGYGVPNVVIFPRPVSGQTLLGCRCYGDCAPVADRVASQVLGLLFSTKFAQKAPCVLRACVQDLRS